MCLFLEKRVVGVIPKNTEAIHKLIPQKFNQERALSNANN
jgi:hypothetical protein